MIIMNSPKKMLEAGGLEAGGLEAGGLEADGLDADGIQSKIIPLCTGCPGAVVTCADLYMLSKIDKYDYIEAIIALNIRSFDIWLTFKNKCNEDIHQMGSWLKKQMIKNNLTISTDVVKEEDDWNTMYNKLESFKRTGMYGDEFVPERDFPIFKGPAPPGHPYPTAFGE
jgi:hypothetical protein